MYKYIKPSLKNVTQDETNWKLIVPNNQRNKFIQLNHDSQKSGHLGIYKTYHSLLSNYYWPGMQRDVYDYIKRCTVCTRYKPLCRKPAGEMTKKPEINQYWQMISIDFVGPLPRSTKGNIYILVITDYLSKFS